MAVNDWRERGAHEVSMGPKVTVAIPTYNRASLLKDCLEMVLRQTFQDFEVIVSDNCSTDDTAETVRAFSDPRIRYYRNGSNLGVYANMNRCLELACGEYITITHDDDFYAPQFIEQEVRLLDAHPNVGMVHCAAFETDSAGMPQWLKVYSDTPISIRKGKEVFVQFLHGHTVYCPSVMARASLYRTVGPYDTRHRSGDYHMWLRMALQADVGYLAQPLVAVRIHEGRLSSALKPLEWFEDFAKVFEEGMAWGEAACPDLLGSKKDLVRKVARTQGRRFLITAFSAAADRDWTTVEGCVEVLRKLQVWGLPKAYAFAAQLSANPAGYCILSPVRQLRRLRGRWGLKGREGWNNLAPERAAGGQFRD